MWRRVLTVTAISATAVAAFGACSKKQSQEPRYTPASRSIPDEQQRPPSTLESDTMGSEAPSGSEAESTWGSGGDSASEGAAGALDLNEATSPAPASGAAPSGGVGEPSSFALTRARCDREMRCKNIGAGKKYETREDCVRDLNRSDSDLFGSNVCANGVDQDQLNRCLSAIRNEGCKSALDKLDTLNACQSTKVCKK